MTTQVSSPAKPRRYHVSWQEFHRDCQALAWRLMEQKCWVGIIAVARGGLVPATIVARELEIRLIDTVCLESYDDKTDTQGEMKIVKPVTGDGDGWLIVDDLVDTGKTAIALRKMLPKAHIAAVFAKPEGKPLADTFVTEVSQDTWIVFPWEEESQSTTTGC